MTYRSFPTPANNHATARELSRSSPIILLVFLLVGSGMFFAVNATPRSQAQSGTTKSAPKKKYRLRITHEYLTAVSLKADKAKLTEVATELSKRLNAQVILGPGLRTRSITVEFYDLPLEPALRLLAPRVYVDYEIRANAQPAPLAVYLMDVDDPDPEKNAVVHGSSEAMLVEGNTEDTSEQSEGEREDDPLQVTLDEPYLTVKSKKQPLAAVLLTIAEVLGVPAEIKSDSNEIVDIEIKDIPVEDAIARVSPNIRLYVRADLTRSRRTPLRLKLVPPAKVPDSAPSQ